MRTRNTGRCWHVRAARSADGGATFTLLGGEVTPLFVIGSTLGASVGELVGLPVGVAAAIGMVATFGAAANTPLACTVMGLELFGTAAVAPMAIGCLVAWVASGSGTIYKTQRHALRRSSTGLQHS